MNRTIEKVFVTAYSHLTIDERQRVCGEGEYVGMPLGSLVGEFNHIIYVSPDPTNATWDDPSEGLAKIMAIAREHGCIYVMFDTDACEEPDVVTYDEG